MNNITSQFHTIVATVVIIIIIMYARALLSLWMPSIYIAAILAMFYFQG